MGFIVHPLLRLTATEPQLLADHLEAYAELVMARSSYALGAWRRRVALFVAGAACAMIAVLLAGVAVMLWAGPPPGGIRAPIVLLAVPCVPALAAIVCWLLARSQKTSGMFDELRVQLRADLTMLREAGAT